MMDIYDEPGAACYAEHRSVHTGVLDALLATGPLRAGARVLEVGCGTASHLQAICARTGAAGYGIDRSMAMVRRARPAPDCAPGAGPAPRLSAADARSLPFGPNLFDLVFSVDVVHHLTDRGDCRRLQAAYAAMARVVRPGGFVVTATDSEATIRARVPLSSHFPETIDYELARYPDEADLLTAHRIHNLDVVAMHTVVHPYVLADTAAFAARAFSCLHSVSDDALARGLARLTSELPLRCVSRNLVIVAQKRLTAA